MRNKVIYCTLSALGGALTGYGIDASWQSTALFAGSALAGALGYMYHKS